jgi:hypothetical protein
MQKSLGKRLVLAGILTIAFACCYAQDVPKGIPPFNMVLSDGATYYNADSVAKNKPLVIIYFDPECGHCQDFTKQLVKNISKFNGVQVVMICAAPGIPPLKKFVDNFGLAKYPNIKAGTEGMYHATMKFYNVDVTPFIALYNKTGALITYYRTMPQIQTIITQLKNK